jgi:hypothetical protein
MRTFNPINILTRQLFKGFSIINTPSVPTPNLTLLYSIIISPSGLFNSSYVKGNGKAIIVTGRGGPLGCETSRLAQFLDNLLTDGREVVSLTRQTQPPTTKIPGTHIC